MYAGPPKIAIMRIDGSQYFRHFVMNYVTPAKYHKICIHRHIHYTVNCTIKCKLCTEVYYVLSTVSPNGKQP